MAQDIRITPGTGLIEPNIVMTSSGVSGVQASSITMSVWGGYNTPSTSGSALVFEGQEGILFAISDNLTSGTIFEVADVTGNPVIEVDATRDINLLRYGTGEVIIAGDGKTTSGLFNVFGTGVITNVITNNVSAASSLTTPLGEIDEVKPQSIVFDASDTTANITQYMLTGIATPSTSGVTIVFSGQDSPTLFSITDNASSGTLFRVAGEAGLPFFEVDASGYVRLIENGTYVCVGTGEPQYELDVYGTGQFKQLIVNAPNSGDTPLILNGVSSQTGDLVQFFNGTTKRGALDDNGRLIFDTNIVTSTARTKGFGVFSKGPAIYDQTGNIVYYASRSDGTGGNDTFISTYNLQLFGDESAGKTILSAANLLIGVPQNGLAIYESDGTTLAELKSSFANLQIENSGLGLSVTADVGQTGNMSEWKNEAGSGVSVDVSGNIVFQSYSDGTRPTAGVAGRVIFNTTDGNLNIDTGGGWILPDGTST